MRLTKLIRAFAAIVAFLALGGASPAQSPCQPCAADLAAQIASILGHGSARLMIRNLSSLPVDDIPAIRKLLEQDLRAHGITANNAPNDTIIRVTLSESARGRTWVAEVIQGDNTQIAIVDIPPSAPSILPPRSETILRREALYNSSEPVLGGFQAGPEIVLLTPNAMMSLALSDIGWKEQQSISIQARLPLARDPRGSLSPVAQPGLSEAWLPGIHCAGLLRPTESQFTVDCHPSDDPWPLTSIPVPLTLPPSSPTPNPPPNPPSPPMQSAATPATSPQSGTSNQAPATTALPTPQIRAFYNAARNYFTGVVSPGMGVDLPPFYSAAILPRRSGAALLINTIDGKVLLESNGKLTAVNGTDDWGSDFALINSGCGDGAQFIVSGADNSDNDTLRAYQITGSDAELSSAPLAIEGTVTALWSAPDGKSALAVIRNAQNQYEVDRVTALCN